MSLVNRHSKTFRRAAWIAVFAVLLPMLVPFIHHPATKIVFNGQEIRICGIASPAPDSGKSTTHKIPQCQICQTMHMLGGGFVPPQVIVLATIAQETGIYKIADRAFVQRFAITSAQPRAPPSLV